MHIHHDTSTSAVVHTASVPTTTPSRLPSHIVRDCPELLDVERDLRRFTPPTDDAAYWRCWDWTRDLLAILTPKHAAEASLRLYPLYEDQADGRASR